MTVKELKEKLEEYGDHLEVMVERYGDVWPIDVVQDDTLANGTIVVTILSEQ